METLDEVMAAGTGVIETLDDLQDWLLRVVHAVRGAIDGCDEVGVTIVADDDAPRTAAYTTTRTLTVDAMQYGVDDGPCLEAHRTRASVVADLDEAEDRWPEFLRLAESEETRCVAAFPLLSGATSMGALNLYGWSDIMLDDEDLLRLAVVASRVGDTAAATYALLDARTLVGQLEEAMASRATIEQAKGIIMARHGVDEDQAFEVLRLQSQRTNTKVSALAATVVEQVRAAASVAV